MGISVSDLKADDWSFGVEDFQFISGKMQWGVVMNGFTDMGLLRIWLRIEYESKKIERINSPVFHRKDLRNARPDPSRRYFLPLIVGIEKIAHTGKFSGRRSLEPLSDVHARMEQLKSGSEPGVLPPVVPNASWSRGRKKHPI